MYFPKRSRHRIIHTYPQRLPIYNLPAFQPEVATPARTSKSPKKTHQEKDGSTNWKGLEPEVPPFKTETLRESFNKKVCKTNQKKHVTHSNISNIPPPQRIYTKKQSKEHSGPGPDTNTSRPDSCCCWIRAKRRCCLTVSTFEPATFERCNFCGKCQQNSGAKTVGALLIFVGCVSTKKTQIIKSSSSPRNFILGPLILRYTY